MSRLGGVGLPAIVTTFYLGGPGGPPDSTMHLPTSPPAWAGWPPPGMIGKRGPCTAPGSRGGLLRTGVDCQPRKAEPVCVLGGPQEDKTQTGPPWRAILGTARPPGTCLHCPVCRKLPEVIGPRPWLQSPSVSATGPSVLGARAGRASILTSLEHMFVLRRSWAGHT